MEVRQASDYSKISNQREADTETARSDYFDQGIGTTADKIRSFARFISRQQVTAISAYIDIFRMTSGVAGSIADCGVFYGQGFMSYANIAAAFEERKFTSKIVGFDTFEGAVGTTEIDQANVHYKREDGEFVSDSYDDLKLATSIFDSDRALNHIPKLELVRGDIRDTAPKYMEKNPDTRWRILHLSMNIYEPTKAALEAFYPRLTPGGIVVVQGVGFNCAGATKAVEEVCGDMPWRDFHYAPSYTYFVKP